MRCRGRLKKFDVDDAENADEYRLYIDYLYTQLYSSAFFAFIRVKN